MKIKYNAPVTLTFSLIAAAVLLADSLFWPALAETFFAVPGKGGFQFGNIPGYLRLFSHVIGHENGAHLAGNFAFILLLGPMLEEKYSSGRLLFMMAVTALVTGLVNILLFPTGLYGASGIVFMMILLSSFTNMKKDEIPLTFLLIVLLYLGREITAMFQTDQISQAAHIIGGLCGSLFGFFSNDPSSSKEASV